MGKLKVCCLLLACLLLVLVAQQQTATPSEPIASTAVLSSSFRELIFKPLWLTGNESGNFMGRQGRPTLTTNQILHPKKNFRRLLVIFKVKKSTRMAMLVQVRHSGWEGFVVCG